MNDYVINPDLKEEAQKQFADLYSARLLMQTRQSGAVSAGRLYAYVQGQHDETVTRLIQENLAARRLYRNLLQRNAYFHVPQAIAASSEEFPERHCNGCKIRLQASRAESNQVYLIIELTDKRRDMPTMLSVFGDDETCEMLELPPARNGVIQTIIDKTSLLAKLLSNPKTETFLR